MAEQGVHSEQGLRSTLREAERARMSRNRLLALSTLTLVSVIGAGVVLQNRAANKEVPAVETVRTTARPANVHNVSIVTAQTAHPVAHVTKQARKTGPRINGQSINGQSTDQNMTQTVVLGPEILPADDANGQAQVRTPRRRRRRHKTPSGTTPSPSAKETQKSPPSNEQAGETRLKTDVEPTKPPEPKSAEDTSKPPDDDPNKP